MKSFMVVMAVGIAMTLAPGAKAQVASIQAKEEAKALLEQAKDLERQATLKDRARPKGTVDPEIIQLRTQAKILRDQAKVAQQVSSQAQRSSNYYRPNGYSYGPGGVNLGNVRTQVYTNGNGGNVRFNIPGVGNVGFGSNGFRFNANNLNRLFR